MRPALVVLLLAAPAFATPTFPAVLEARFGVAPSEGCAVCHTGSGTGANTVNTPFGRALRMRGLQPHDETSLAAALDALADGAVDSDGDGVADVAELMAGTSPNLANPASGGGGPDPVVVLPPAQFGCGAAVVPELIFLSALLPLLRSRRRKPC